MAVEIAQTPAMPPAISTPHNGDGLDKIGDWSVDKLEVLKTYAKEYALILQNQKENFHTGYIDAFAGAGEHVHKDTGAVVPGSPANALNLPHKFDEYHFIDLNPERVQRLQRLGAGRDGVTVHHGNCNEVLMREIFPRFRWEDYRRALCFLDPYGMHLDWRVMAKAGEMRSFEIFLNFPIMDINRNAKRAHVSEVDPEHRARMDAFWGDDSWHAAMFAPSPQGNFFETLLGGSAAPDVEKRDNEAFVAAFRRRLQEVAGFKFVPKPVPMRNKRNAVVYYLFFASNNSVGNRIASHIFKAYRSE